MTNREDGLLRADCGRAECGRAELARTELARADAMLAGGPRAETEPGCSGLHPHGRTPDADSDPSASPFSGSDPSSAGSAEDLATDFPSRDGCRTRLRGWAGAHSHGAVRPRRRAPGRGRPPGRWC